MPFWAKKKDGDTNHINSNGPPMDNGKTNSSPNSPSKVRQNTPTAPNGTAGHSPGRKAATPEDPPARPRLVFHCQQAHGSPTGIISGFTNVKELYQKIADCYDMTVGEILFCTLNTHKVDMSRLLGGQIGLDDFIFAHCKGQAKEIDIQKSEDALGLTITDNGAGYAFIKRIKEGSIMDRIEHVRVGDHIERINEKSLVGCRHFEVARMLKEIPKGTTFMLRLVEPLKAFSEIGPRTGGGNPNKKSVGSGKATLRLRANKPATVEDAPDEMVQKVNERINALLDNFMGINDVELSQTIWELGQTKSNPHDFAVSIDESDLAGFGFTDDLIFDLWGIISDAKAGRLKDPDDTGEKGEMF